MSASLRGIVGISCAAGIGAGKGVMKRVNAFSRLMMRLDEAVTAVDAVEPEEDTAAAAPDDPMNLLDPLVTDVPSPQKKKRKYIRKRCEDHIFFVEMPILPGEAGAEAEAAGTRRVDVMARGAKTIFIGVDDVE